MTGSRPWQFRRQARKHRNRHAKAFSDYGKRVGELGGQPRVKSSVSTVIPGEI
jgi:hypothetical protein